MATLAVIGLLRLASPFLTKFFPVKERLEDNMTKLSQLAIQRIQG